MLSNVSEESFTFIAVRFLPSVEMTIFYQKKRGGKNRPCNNYALLRFVIIISLPNPGIP